MPPISILMPTRKRPEWAKLSITTLCENAENLNNFNILCAIDNDDKLSLTKLESFAEEKQWPIQCFVYPRFGYSNLQKYYNSLSSLTDAQLLWLFNDDFVVTSKHWDTRLLEVLQNAKDPYFIIEPLNFTSGNIGPLISSELVNFMGQFSPHCMNDAYWDGIASQANCVVRLPTVKFYHYKDEAINNPASQDTNRVIYECMKSWKSFRHGPQFVKDVKKLCEKVREIRQEQWIKTWNSSNFLPKISKTELSQKLKVAIQNVLKTTAKSVKQKPKPKPKPKPKKLEKPKQKKQIPVRRKTRRLR